MSVLGMSWNGTEIMVSCRPDPAKPAGRLRDFCDFPIPQSVSLDDGAGGVKNIPMAQVMEALVSLANQYRGESTTSWATDAFTTYTHGLVAEINANDALRVLFMEEDIDHIAFASPEGMQPEAIKRFEILAGNQLSPDFTIVAHPISCIAYTRSECVAGRPFLLAEWRENIILQTVFPYETGMHFSRVGQLHKIGEIGPKRWAQVLAKALHRDHQIHVMSNVWQDGTSPEMTVFQSDLTRLTKEMLSSGGPFEIPVRRRGKAGGDVLRLDLSYLLASLRPITMRLNRFLSTALPELRRHCDDGLIVFSGDAFCSPIFRPTLVEALERTGLRPCNLDVPAELLGLHYCVSEKPKLPYDCGILIKRPGDENGIGTLVLMRPASVGTRRDSGPLEILMSGLTTLEVTFYLRCLDMTTKNVRYEEMISHRMAPEIDDQGYARVSASMQVCEKDGEEGNLTLCIELLDETGGEVIRFEHLPITGGRPMYWPPLRHAESPIGLHWGKKISHGIMQQQRPQDMTVDEWWELFNPPVDPPQKWSRLEYAEWLLEAVGAVIYLRMNVTRLPAPVFLMDAVGNTLLKEEWVLTCPPAEFQYEARKALLAAMANLNRQIGERGYINAWIRENESIADNPPHKGYLFRGVLNAVSQEMAGRAEEVAYVSYAERLATRFELTCYDPMELKFVDWQG